MVILDEIDPYTLHQRKPLNFIDKPNRVMIWSVVYYVNPVIETILSKPIQHPYPESC